ncbi:MAG: hypothetical protein WDO13_06645 [Verrucomicrobiota bacterium]
MALLVEVTGATISSQSAVAGTPPPSRGPITLRTRRVEALLGVHVAFDVIENQLARLGCVKLAPRDGNSVWQPPSFRDDLAREVDLIEEIARLHGLDGVPSRVSTNLHRETDADRGHARLSCLRHALARARLG